ncbi:MAG: histidine kinase [Betaproteobacteria bacterium HGW-Betaproteobacteria-10]|nr:MAG: histidine kinase [Betaproteobacteria bacterium HGW-Betaproteobacteria-10]
MPLKQQTLVAIDVEEIGRTLSAWRKNWPEMGVLALLPEAEKDQLATLQAAFRQHQVPLVGAIFPALVSDTHFVTSGVCLLCFDHMPPHFLISNLAIDGGIKLAGAVLPELEKCPPPADNHPTLFLIFDAMIGNIASILNQMHLVLGTRACCVGANAGSETFQPMPCLFDREKVIANGVLGLLLPGEPKITVQHGYPVAKSLMSATSVASNRIDKINHRAAFTVYQEVIEAEYGIRLTPENFYDHAVHFPFGLVTIMDVLVRIPVAFTSDGALFCVGEVPPNTMLRLLKAPDLESSHGVRDIAASLGAAATRDQPLLTFYCAGRRMHFAAEAVTELAQLKAATGAASIFGALTLGEIDCIEDLCLPRFHNAALVCLSLS